MYIASKEIIVLKLYHLKTENCFHAVHILAESWVATTRWVVCVAEGVVGSYCSKVPGMEIYLKPIRLVH